MILFSHKYITDNPFYSKSASTIPIQSPIEFSQVKSNTLDILSKCSSDAYLLVTIPNLTRNDLKHWEKWRWARMTAASSSSIMALSNVIIDDLNETSNYIDSFKEDIEKKLRLHCNVQIEKYNYPNKVEKYIDTRLRLFDVNLNILNAENEEERLAQLEEINSILYEITRMIPSPNLFLILTSATTERIDEIELNKSSILTLEEIPDDMKSLPVAARDRSRKSDRWIWPDITIFDKTRWIGFERNPAPKGRVIDDDDTWLEKKSKKQETNGRFEEIEREDFIDFKSSRQFLLDNIIILFGGFSLLVVVIGKDLASWIWSKLSRNEKKNDLVESSTDDTDSEHEHDEDQMEEKESTKIDVVEAKFQGQDLKKRNLK
ncbi:hypothetical protein DAMA08_034270 [Martiniozyma asiatica (nom. inval.)]|nr:hypothetical protein DAMA08_034270 [Martiniozyma asiatica]